MPPAHRSADPLLGPEYASEPYVVAGDICSEPPWAGRGGWSWYTGAASWLQRAALESICGVTVRGRLLRLDPRLPPHWPGAELRLQRNGRTHHITLLRNEQRLLELQEQEGGPRLVQVGETMDLDTLAEGSHLMLLLDHAGSTPVAAPLARRLLLHSD